MGEPGDPGDPGDLDDDLPPLVGEDGEELSDELPPHRADAPDIEQTVPTSAQRPDTVEEKAPRTKRDDLDPDVERPKSRLQLPEGASEEQALQAAAALRAARLAQGDAAPIAESDALRGALEESEGPRAQLREPCERTKRMIAAITRDDFEECEDAILQGADVNADCGAGMHAIHLAALRGEMFLTELLLAHGADVNERDASGNSPLIYTCHFFKQHGKGVQMVAQLLFHRADPWFRVKDGKMAGTSAYDIMDKACGEPQMDENVPRQMRAMIQLAMDGTDQGFEAINQMWMNFKSQNKKLYQVSSKKDNYDYLMRNRDWTTPDGAKNTQAAVPTKLEDKASILEEKFTYIRDYSFTDEGEKIKVYITFPESAAASLKDPKAVDVSFDFQAFDVKLRTPSGEAYRLRLDPLFGSIEVAECKHRVSAASKRVSLTLVKRHKQRVWNALLKSH